MTNKAKFRKNRKLKSKMKGGKADIGPSAPAASGDKSAAGVPPLPTEKDMPVAKGVPVRAKSGGVSDYGSLNMKYFIYGVSAIGFMGVLWFFLSRSMIRHEYSEAVSYGLIALAIFFSFFMVLLAGLKSMRAGSGIMNGFKYLFKVILYALTKCLPAILICIQIGILIYIYIKHGNYLYTSDSIPALFNTFSTMAAVMILGQSFVWYKQVNKIVLGENKDSNPALVPGFILAAILSTIAISQMYVILEFLKTDC